MRLLRNSVLGTLAIAPLVSGQAELHTPAITFRNGFYGALPSAPQEPIFTLMPSQVFTFDITPGIIVADAFLLDEDGKVISSATNARRAAATSSTVNAPAIATATTATTITGKGLNANPPAAQATDRSNSGSLGKREDSDNFTLMAESKAGSITFNSSSLSTTYLNKKLYLRVHWENNLNGMAGYTYSRDFVYVAQADASSSLTSVLPLVSATAAASPETTFPKTATATSAVTSAATVTLGATSSSKKGLATGAVAGIAIGVVADVAIVGGIVLYLYRRRARLGRLSGSAEPYHGSGSEQIGLQSGLAAAGVAEKDGTLNGSVSVLGNAANGGAHSTHSDDVGGVVGVVGAGAGAVHARSVGASPTATTARAEHLSAPASPASPASPTSPVSASAASTGAATAATAAPKPGVSGQVAALIEEDMTAEDVARLEAEERELDAAIETAMRSRHA